MEEQALSAVLKALRKGQCILILDLESREAKTNLFFPIASSLIFFGKL
jgi:3,4-dihydroxy-2-butanone 4-phosphate synthase